MSQTSSPTTVPGSTPPASGSYNFGFGGSGPAAGTTSAPTSALTTGNPLISQDQGTFSQYYLTQIGSYTVNTQGVPGMNDATTIGAALQDIYDMSPGQLTQLQELLMSGGFYRDGSGNPMTNLASIKLGTADPQTWLALGRALSQASTSGMSLQQMLIQSGAGGAGLKNIEGSLNPVTGGGNTDQINLTNPQDVYQTAYQVFEQALGRAPNQAELNAVTAALHSQETAYQQGQNQQAESASQSKYQQQLNSRNALTTPQSGSGPVPNGPINTPEDFAVAVLQFMGAPVNASNISFLTNWVNQNGGLGSGNNPLGVKSSAAGSTQGAGGVQSYASWAQGIQATVNLLSSPQYQSIFARLQSGQPVPSGAKSTINSELSQWSGGKVTGINPTSQEQTAAQQAAGQQNAQQMPMTNAGGPASNYLHQTGAPASIASPSALAAGTQAPSTNNQTGNAVPPGQTSPAQGLSSPGDSYLPANTLTDTAAPSAGAAAFTAATTGANAVPYLWNQYLQALNAVSSMIKGNGPTG